MREHPKGVPPEVAIVGCECARCIADWHRRRTREWPEGRLMPRPLFGMPKGYVDPVKEPGE